MYSEQYAAAFSKRLPPNKALPPDVAALRGAAEARR